MTNDNNDVVRVAAGEMVRIELYKQALVEAGIEAHVLGESLGASFGTAIPGSVELWVHKSVAARAEGIIQGIDSGHGKRTGGKNAFPHPASDPHPKRQGGHGPHTHYNPDPGT